MSIADEAPGRAFDDLYELPIFRHRTLEAFLESAPDTGIHLVSLGASELPILLHLFPGEQLNVGFQGAVDRAKKRIPLFERRASFSRKSHPFVLFADPSLALDREMTLSWFTGTADVDLVPILRQIVRGLVSQVGASRSILVGNSGGGFAALQVGAELPGSAALVFAPQIEVVRFHPVIVRKYLSVCFAGLSADEARDRHPDRLSAAVTYRGPHANVVRYVQNTQDDHHLANHFGPFLEATDGGTGDPDSPPIEVVRVDLGPGHIGPSHALVGEHLAAIEATLTRCTSGEIPAHRPKEN
jgi:pimeloyl-ACP methyl ester carboxylesterase